MAQYNLIYEEAYYDTSLRMVERRQTSSYTIYERNDFYAQKRARKFLLNKRDPFYRRRITSALLRTASGGQLAVPPFTKKPLEDIVNGRKA